MTVHPRSFTITYTTFLNFQWFSFHACHSCFLATPFFRLSSLLISQYLSVPLYPLLIRRIFMRSRSIRVQIRIESPHATNISLLSRIRPMFPHLPLIFLPFLYNSCITCVSGYTFRIPLKVPSVESFVTSCLCNYAFICPATLVPHSKCQMSSFLTSVAIFERLRSS